MMFGASGEELARAKAIYDEQIAPLMEQIDAITREHGFFYLAAVQYGYHGVAGSCGLGPKSDKSMQAAWAIIDMATVWDEQNKTE